VEIVTCLSRLRVNFVATVYRCRALKIGVAKEIKTDEYRVALTPAGALELIRRGHDVLIETGAGEGSAFPDQAYERLGASIGSVEQVWGESELLLKVKEPIAAEYPRLRRGLVLFTYLHLAADPALTRALVESGVTAVAYETVETEDRRLPLLAPMSEIAGRLAAQAGAYFLEKPLGGRGLLLGGVPGVAPGRVVVLGGGIVGYNAAVIALGLGANVTILERSIDRMRHLDEILSGRVSLVMSSSLQIAESIKEADLVIGAVLIPGALAPKLITRAMLHDMKQGAVFCDVAIDQGGCAETSLPTTHSDPVYEVDGILHYCVANMPGGVPITSTKALTNATLPYVEQIADLGLPEAVALDRALALGVNVVDRKITYEAVAEAHGLEYTPLENVVLAAV
jgi:alanine dehydrogenase